MDRIRQIGQLFVFGFEGYRAGEGILRLIRDYGIGGVILFSRNIETPRQTTELVQNLQAHSEIPLLIGIDQEGGIVSRLPEPFTQFPGNHAVGLSGSTDLAYRFGRATGRELASVGINLDFAPVLDINSNPANPVIGTRSFGAVPEQVAKLGCAVIRGLQESVIACGKHFPGHGDTSQDSHLALPSVLMEKEKLQQRELIPFAAAIDGGVEALMTSHVLYPSLDPDLPATLSPAVVQGLLREELRFNGVVVTDDLEMKAVEDHFGTERSCVMALQAGVDLLLICHDPDKQEKGIEAVIRALEAGEISMERVEESVARVLDLKRRRLQSAPPIDTDQMETTIGKEEHHRLAKVISAYLEG
jgi:beta-N-acetylhexosaminidase